MALFNLFYRNISSMIVAAPRLSIINTSRCYAFHPTPILQKKTIFEDLNLPAPPVKPMVPFIKFLVDNKANFSNISQKERVQKLSLSWATISPEERAERLQKYYEERKEYNIKFEQFLEQLSPEQVASVNEEQIRRKTDKNLRKIKGDKKKELESLCKPKHPASTFVVFIKSLEYKEGVTRKTFVSEAAAKWKELSVSERERFKLQAAKAKEVYNKELLKWETRMLKEGRPDLLRKKSLQITKPNELEELEKN